MPTHQDSLSVVLPVHNVAGSLAASINQLLELLPDLAERFEILVVDEGSDDQTAEVAHELALIYPQVLVAKHPLRRGQAGVVETALARTSGDILMVQDENAPINACRYRRLWDLRGNERLTRPLSRLRLRPALARRIAACGVRLEDDATSHQPGGLQLIRRPTRLTPTEVSPRVRRIDTKSDVSHDGVPQFTISTLRS